MDCNPPGFHAHGFPRQEYWSGLPFPPPGDLPDPRIKPRDQRRQTTESENSTLGRFIKYLRGVRAGVTKTQGWDFSSDLFTALTLVPRKGVG